MDGARRSAGAEHDARPRAPVCPGTAHGGYRRSVSARRSGNAVDALRRGRLHQACRRQQPGAARNRASPRRRLRPRVLRTFLRARHAPGDVRRDRQEARSRPSRRRSAIAGPIRAPGQVRGARRAHRSHVARLRADRPAVRPLGGIPPPHLTRPAHRVRRRTRCPRGLARRLALHRPGLLPLRLPDGRAPRYRLEVLLDEAPPCRGRLHRVRRLRQGVPRRPARGDRGCRLALGVSGLRRMHLSVPDRRPSHRTRTRRAGRDLPGADGGHGRRHGSRCRRRNGQRRLRVGPAIPCHADRSIRDHELRCERDPRLHVDGRGRRGERPPTRRDGCSPRLARGPDFAAPEGGHRG